MSASRAKDGEVVGRVFDIQHFSIHDGPGIRTTVFLKGCPLTCVWCQNPESQAAEPEIMFLADRCVGCGRCVEACPSGAVTMENNLAHTDRSICSGAGRCVDACLNGARALSGKGMTAAEVVERVMVDAIFYERSGGGLTLSGGEPLAQPAFSEAILRLSKAAGLHTVVDTCGYARWDAARRVLEHADLVLFDLKHIDMLEHERLVGVPNDVILDNARKIRHELRAPMQARVPLVPGYNDAGVQLSALARFIAEELGPDTPVHLHPYHRFGEGKYEALEKTGPRPELHPPGDDQVRAAVAVFERVGLRTTVGG